MPGQQARPVREAVRRNGLVERPVPRSGPTSLDLAAHGAYPEADGDYATPKYGHPKNRRADLKQVQTGLATTGDGGIPLLPRAYDGGAGEVAQVPGARALVELAGPASSYWSGTPSSSPTAT